MLIIPISYSTRKIMVKILRKHLLPVCQSTSMSTKQTSHYDSLEVSPNATQNEIKSAYYKLSLQYHPDKNKSASAKQKFQQISDAYEVIGSYTTRKQYDRQMKVKYRPLDVEKDKEDWPIQPEIETHVSPKSKMYDFNTWTQMHYQHMFDIRQERLKTYSQYKEKYEKTDDKTESHALKILAVFILILMYVFSSLISNNDVRIVKEPHNKP